MVLIVTLLSMLVVLGVAGAIAAYISRVQQRRDRIVSLVSGNRAGISENKDEALARQRAESIAKKLKEAGAELNEKKKDRASLREMMMQAGIERPLSHYWAGSAAFAVFAFAALNLMTDWPQIAVWFLTFTAFFGVPKWYLKKKAASRQKKFLSEFADALDASVRLLQAGMPISEAVAMASREFTGPLREEMQRLYENQKIGTPLGAAALDMARRIPIPEVHMFATALQIQSETGSSLSEVLSNLSSVIRARFRLRRKVQALSQEAKASAAIIGALPPLVALGLYLVNEEYIMVLFTTTTGKWLLSGALCWMSIGILIMKQMINFKI